MQISRYDAARLGFTMTNDGGVVPNPYQIIYQLPPKLPDKPADDEIIYSPSTEQMILLFKQHEEAARKHDEIRREIAVLLLQDRYISVKKLAEELGVSRPTLYVWERELYADNDTE